MSYGADFWQAVKEFGEPVRFRYFTKTHPGAGSGYDDDVSLSQSGTDFWTSGVINPVQAKFGSHDAILFEQGRIAHDDTKLYVSGGVQTTGLWRVGIGSPVRGEYAPVEDGIIAWTAGAELVYKKLFVRLLSTGSLNGE